MKRSLHLFILFIFISGAYFSGCSQLEKEAEISAEPHQPEWTKSANIYEVNIRQYTEEGTFNAFREEMPRLSDMGVDILWLMPIHPIGEKNRKGELGSYYSVKDYKGINPNYGTLEDFQALVDEAHELGMKVIIDWVPNHTAWDHPWITEHPEYYAKDEEGNITYEADWTDIALLDYVNNRELWTKMTDAMSYWVTEANIDGYRVDHAAHEIPMEFWEEAIPAVDENKSDLFWLAEWAGPDLYPTFDASYAWEYFHLTTDIASGEKTFDDLDEYMNSVDTTYPETAYQMYFTSNHDENSWNGTDQQLFGANFENFAVMAATIDGFFLVYSGQETGLDKQLEFFTKDAIEWDGYEYADFYNTLFTLIDENKALWNGAYGGDFNRIQSPDGTYAYKRVKEEDEVIVFINNTGQELSLSVNLDESMSYTSITTGLNRDTISSVSDMEIFAKPNGWVILATE